MPLRADGSPLRAFRSPGLRIAAPARLPEAFTSVAFVGRRLPAHSCATAPVSHRISRADPLFQTRKELSEQ